MYAMSKDELLVPNPISAPVTLRSGTRVQGLLFAMPNTWRVYQLSNVSAHSEIKISVQAQLPNISPLLVLIRRGMVPGTLALQHSE